MSYSREAMDELHAQVKLYKEALVGMRGAHTDIAPQLHILLGERSFAGVPTEVFESLIDNDIQLPAALAVAIRVKWREEGKQPLNGIQFISEGFMKRVPEDEAPGKYQRGDFQQEYASDPASNVQECINILVMERDDFGGIASSQVTQPFGYDDGGVVLWYEPIASYDINLSDTTGGAIVEQFLICFNDLGEDHV